MPAVASVFVAFLKLGLTSFGGPVAHLGYFRDEFVTRRRWENDRGYGELLALCQFLPGPSSSQVGFAIGLRRAGLAGALAAFVAFTLPSATLMVLAAASIRFVTGPAASGALSGLTIVAVAVVAQAVWGMARTLAPDRPRASIAIAAAIAALVIGGTAGQLGALVAGAVAGLLWSREAGAAASEGDPSGRASADGAVPRVPRTVGVGALALFVALLVGAPIVAAVTGSASWALFEAFFRSGALVFGGGHVVLPLLESAVVEPGWVSSEAFLAGYGAAQALPGPLFAFAAYLGAISSVGPGGVAGAALALGAVFLPGFLLLVGALPLWSAVRARPWAAGVVRGAGAAVVGILAAALYDPVFTTAITGPGSFALALGAFGLLVIWRCPPWIVVVLGALAGSAAAVLA